MREKNYYVNDVTLRYVTLRYVGTNSDAGSDYDDYGFDAIAEISI